MPICVRKKCPKDTLGQILCIHPLIIRLHQNLDLIPVFNPIKPDDIQGNKDETI